MFVLEVIPPMDQFLQYGALGVLLLTLYGGYRVGNRLLDMFDRFMNNHFEHLTSAVTEVGEKIDVWGTKIDKVGDNLDRVSDRLGYLVGVEKQKGEEYKEIKEKELGN